MKLGLVLLAVLAVAAAGRVKRQGNYGGPQVRFSPPHGFRAPEQIEHLERNSVAPTSPPLLHVTRHQNLLQQRAQEQQRVRPQELAQGKRPLGPPFKDQNLKEEELEEEEKEEPDRLTMLLPQSKFSCQGRSTGYYADDGLNCEIFHYCQDNARHSWICPEGFVFHQVHLICMPPSGDNICTQSSQYHFVNEYLYKAINADEVKLKPNVTLRYSERYYPQNFYSEEDLSRVQQLQEPQQQVVQTPRPVHRQPNQVFHSPEEVNIPLQHRRPVGGPQPLRNFSPQPNSQEYEY